MKKNLIPFFIIPLLLAACAEQTSYSTPKNPTSSLPKVYFTPYEQLLKNNERANKLNENASFTTSHVYSKSL